jgi:histone family protein DNA-binding protein
MTKSELIKNIHRKNNFKYVDIENIVNDVLSEITEGLEKDGKVVLTGFGTFEKYYQEGYNGINPSTGAKLSINGSYKIRFSSSKKLKDYINK